MRLQDLVGSATSLPSIPKVAQELMEAFSNETASMDMISQKLKMDHALAAKVLRLANSAKYSRSREVESVDAAAVVLGLDVLKTLIISSGVASAFKHGVSKQDLWRNSFMAAETMKLLAEQTNKDTDTGFTIGLLHNIGEILIASLKPEMYKQYLANANSVESKNRVEKRVYGLTSAAAGTELAGRWSFPNAVVDAISSQDENPGEAADSSWARLLALAVALDCEHSAKDTSSGVDLTAMAAAVKVDLPFVQSAMSQIVEDTESYLSLLE